MTRGQTALPSNPFKRVEPLYQLPANLFVPEDAYAIDIDQVLSVNASTVNQDFLTVNIPDTAYVYFTHFAVMSDVGNPFATKDDVYFRFFAGNKQASLRVLPWHGVSVNDAAWPTSNSRIWPRGSITLDNNNLRNCNLKFSPFDVFRVEAGNETGSAVTLGIRLVGFVSNKPFESEARI